MWLLIAEGPRKTAPWGENADQLRMTKSAQAEQGVDDRADTAQCLKAEAVLSVLFSTCSQPLPSDASQQTWGHTDPSL